MTTDKPSLRSFRYFTYTKPDGTAHALARMDPARGVAERVARGDARWVAVPTLLDLVFTDDNLDWDEVDRAAAEAFLNEMGVAVSMLDGQSGERL